jgi:hypothetical protein
VCCFDAEVQKVKIMRTDKSGLIILKWLSYIFFIYVLVHLLNQKCTCLFVNSEIYFFDKSEMYCFYRAS